MTDDRLTELAALAEAAMPPEWEVQRFPGRSDVWSVAINEPVCQLCSPEDATFIAAAREAVPELLAEVRRMRADLQYNAEVMDRAFKTVQDSRGNLLIECRSCHAYTPYREPKTEPVSIPAEELLRLREEHRIIQQQADVKRIAQHMLEHATALVCRLECPCGWTAEAVTHEEADRLVSAHVREAHPEPGSEG